MERKTFLITGAAGFIGSNLTERLLRDGYNVKALDNLLTGKLDNLAFTKKLCSDIVARFEFIEGDIRDVATVTAAIEGVDYILHQAALPSVARSVEDPAMSHDINVNGTLNILEAARKSDADIKIVYAASSSAYGDTPTLPKIETMPAKPLSPYALQKFTAEEYMRIYHSIFGVKTVSLRYFNVFGPQQDPKSLYAAVIPSFISAFLKDTTPTVYGDGEQTRDFTYIDNVVQANIRAALSSDDANGKVFNIACGKRISLNQLLKLLERKFNRSANTEYCDARAGDVKHSLADINRAKELLGYSPEVAFEEGLANTVDYFAANMNTFL